MNGSFEQSVAPQLRDAYNAAIVYAGLGERDHVFIWLERLTRTGVIFPSI